ncbi:MAG TPA: hypothetical protein VHK24_09685 [Steroidobacter sp.]|jgi:hypothetical protein|nr:hypothetical protein [Steroidobacter sp.]
MILKLNKTPPPQVVRPRVTPDPDYAAELQRRIESLAYYPENGFHRDRSQARLPPPRLRLSP